MGRLDGRGRHRQLVSCHSVIQDVDRVQSNIREVFSHLCTGFANAGTIEKIPERPDVCQGDDADTDFGTVTLSAIVQCKATW